MDVPLFMLDRDVARAALESARARTRLARGEIIEASPLSRMRRVSSKETWLELEGAKDPLAAPMRPWIARLTLDRVLWADQVRLAAAWNAPSIHVEEPGLPPLTTSPRALLARVIADPEPARRRTLADALARGAGPAADAARILAERRAEAARLFGADLDALEIPCEPRASLASIAERVLVETAPALRSASRWDEALFTSLAREAGEGWPSRMSARWLFDLFHAGPLLEGLRLDLPPLPASIGAASFARALRSFGAALAREDGPRSAPFVIAHPPVDARVERRAALFAGLAADPVFTARALGLGRDRARDQARAVARALSLSLRLDAARVLCRGALVLPGRQGATRFEERTFDAIGAPIPAALAGLVPRLGPADPARLVGAVAAARDRRALVERFDEDWFRSPHAAQAIREEDAAVPASPSIAEATLSEGLTEIGRALGDLV